MNRYCFPRFSGAFRFETLLFGGRCAFPISELFDGRTDILKTFDFLDGDAWPFLTLLAGVQSLTEFLGTTVAFGDHVLGDPNLLRESITVDVMMVPSFSMPSPVLLHAVKC